MKKILTILISANPDVSLRKKKKTHTVPSCSCSAASVGAQGSWHQFVYSAARWINIAPIPSQIVRATMRFL